MKYKTQEEARQAAIEAWTKGEISHDEENNRYIVNGEPYEYQSPSQAPRRGVLCYTWDDNDRPEYPSIRYSSGSLDRNGKFMSMDIYGRAGFSWNHWEVFPLADPKTAERLERAVKKAERLEMELECIADGLEYYNKEPGTVKAIRQLLSELERSER